MKKSILTFMFFAGFSSLMIGQEIRIQGSFLILGTINDPFLGVGIGLENPMGKHFSLNLDGNYGTQERGTTLEFRTAVRYFPGKNQIGFYIGPVLKYINLKEKNEIFNRYDNHLYAPGFDIGVKTDFLGFSSLGINLNPHLTVGGDGESAVAGMSAQVALGFYF